MLYPSSFGCWPSVASIACTVTGGASAVCLDCEEGTPIRTDDFCWHAAFSVCTKIVFVQALSLMSICCAERTVMRTCPAAFLVRICPRALTRETNPAAGLVDR